MIASAISSGSLPVTWVNTILLNPVQINTKITIVTISFGIDFIVSV